MIGIVKTYCTAEQDWLPLRVTVVSSDLAWCRRGGGLSAPQSGASTQCCPTWHPLRLPVLPVPVRVTPRTAPRQPGDPSAFPDFATPALGDDELEVALLQRPAAAARGGGGAGGVGSRASSGPSRPASAPAAMAAARDGPARGTGPQGAAAVAAVAASPVAAAGGAELSNGNGNGNGRVEQESGSGDIGVSGMSWEVDEEEAMELLGAGEAGGGTRGGGGEQQGPLQLAPRPTAMRRRQRPAQRQQEQQQVQ